MKQITLDDITRTRLKKAVGDDVNLDNLAVFKAAALNTAPIRKVHPIYFNGVHSTSFLHQMAQAVNNESLPLQIMHDEGPGDGLPIGRVFFGQVLPGAGHNGTDELEVLFWIDKSTSQDKVDLVNNSTVDQVSVAVMAKEILSNKTGFDFLSDESDLFDNIMAGKDDKGNIMGKDGAHVIMNNLDAWHEMSLVGKGGAVGARIKGSGATQTNHLLASNKDVPLLTLQMSIGDNLAEPKTPDLTKKDDVEMDAKDFAGIITENATKVANLTSENTTLKGEKTTLEAQVAALNAELTTLKASDNVKKVSDLETEKAELTTKLTAATDLHGKLVGPLFAAAGKTGEQLDADPVKAVTQVTQTVAGLRGLFSGQPRQSQGADFNGGDVTRVNGGPRVSPYARAGQ